MKKDFNQKLFEETFKRHKLLMNESVGNLNESTMEWKDIPDEIREKAYDMIDAHNKNVDPSNKRSYYAIDVTGKYQVYYTFWRVREDIPPEFAGFIKNPIYMGNLTTDLLGSVTKALSRPAVQKVRLELWTDDTKKGLIGKTKKTPTFTFGKYRGRTLADVYLENPSYFAWLAKNQDPKYAHTEMATNIRFFADMYFKDMTKKNLETSKSQFVGNKGDRISGKFKVYGMSIKVKQAFSYYDRNKSLGNYVMYKMVDANDNKVVANGVEKILIPDLPEGYKMRGDNNEIIFYINEYDTTTGRNNEKRLGTIKKGDEVSLSGKVVDTYEALGIKFTKLGYLKPEGYSKSKKSIKVPPSVTPSPEPPTPEKPTTMGSDFMIEANKKCNIEVKFGKEI